MNPIPVLFVFFICNGCSFANKVSPVFRTIITTREEAKNDENIETTTRGAYKGTYIDVEVLEKQHNLMIGQCTSGLKELHKENIILNNDGKSHVTAGIRINVDKPVDIVCVRITDANPANKAYPSYLGGGVGHDFIEFSISTIYGKGFHFFVEILGHYNKIESRNKHKNINI